MLGCHRVLLLCLVVLVAGANAIAFNDRPSPDSCEYYQVLEDRFHCERDTPYLIQYAKHYCLKFKERKSRWSPAMKSWVENTTSCLQSELARHVDEFNACHDIREFGYNSHMRCYVDSGFCKLNAWQRLKIIRTVSIGDLLRYSAGRGLNPFECSKH